MKRSTLLAVLVVTSTVTGPLARADVTATVNGTAGRKAISSLIYGSNQTSVSGTSMRLGGNRWTAYNWETNASNAGNDYYYQNDGYLSSSNVPGAAILPTLQSSAAAGQATILTVPMAGYVSADKGPGGDVRYTNNTFSNGVWTQGTANPNYLAQRFKVMSPAKGAAFSLTPNTSDGNVYADEFVNWVNANKTAGQQVIYDLDNEPDLWSSTHAEVHPAATTYAELSQKNVAYATAIKAVAPDAKVFGAVNYGWTGYRNLQNAPDANGRDFQAYFLQQMKAADAVAGKRLVDALDFHWYPEATGTNASGVATRIDGSDVSAGVSAARIQAPRSLWDPNYVEASYIPGTLPANGIAGKAIQLLPRTQALINANDPGIAMAIGEYNYGGGGDVSGGVAEADVLGIFAEQGVYAANYWDEGNGTSFVNAALRMYRNYDGHGAHAGDTTVGSVVSNDGTASVHASVDSATGKLTLVLINKSTTAQTISLSLANLGAFGGGQAYQFNGTSVVVNGVVQIGRLADVALANPTAFSFLANPTSVTTIALTPVPEPAALGVAAAAAIAPLIRRRRRPRTAATMSGR